MTTPRFLRPVEAWRSLVRLVAAVTQPRADTAGCDARVEALAADSRIVRALSAAADACGRAAATSAAVGTWRRGVVTLVPASLAERVRAAGCVAFVAASTALVLRAAGTATEPLTWMLPAAVGAIALASIAGAKPIARAIASYHS